MKQVKLLVAGAGHRGHGYSQFALAHPEKARVVGVAEPRDYYRSRMAREHAIVAENVFSDWRNMAGRPKFADAVIIATVDSMHVEPAVAFAKQGYHILLEKPMAPTVPDCRQIVESALAQKIILAVCHVLRYTDYTRTLKQLLDAGAIGDIVSIQHLEPVGYWHQVHSFVRGNWRREQDSSFMLLSKSCHDLDWIRYVMGTQCKSVSSFGALKHFSPKERPEGAAERCLDCDIESECSYSAKKIYLGRLERGHTRWPVDVLTSDLTAAGIKQALRDGPYGRCVYDCDNDVVDHQVVNLLFAGDRTASFTMTAFTEATHRRTRIFGTKGEIEGDGSKIRIFDFLTDQSRVIDTKAPEGTILGGHGGGDYWLMHHFIEAVANNDPSRILSGPEETLESHLIAFAAEQARKEHRVVDL